MDKKSSSFSRIGVGGDVFVSLWRSGTEGKESGISLDNVKVSCWYIIGGTEVGIGLRNHFSLYNSMWSAFLKDLQGDYVVGLDIACQLCQHARMV